MRRLPALQIIGGSCTLCTLLVFFTPVHAAAHGIKWDGHDPTMAQTPERSETTKISAPTTARTALTSTITTRPSLPDGGVLRRALASDTICGWDMGMICTFSLFLFYYYLSTLPTYLRHLTFLVPLADLVLPHMFSIPYNMRPNQLGHRRYRIMRIHQLQLRGLLRHRNLRLPHHLL